MSLIPHSPFGGGWGATQSASRWREFVQMNEAVKLLIISVDINYQFNKH